MHKKCSETQSNCNKKRFILQKRVKNAQKALKMHKQLRKKSFVFATSAQMLRML